MPGYTGFVPSAAAEHIYGRTAAAVGQSAILEQSRRRRQRSAPLFEAPVPAEQLLRVAERPGPREAEAWDGSRPMGGCCHPSASGEHPLGRSRAEMVRNHWVPTIPGYSGHIPGKHGENICGGGVIHTCKMAGRAIAERHPLAGSTRQVGMKDSMQRSRLVDLHQARNGAPDAGDADERANLAAGIREHCSKQIPGYTGHVPRVHGESIHGATSCAANLIAADFCEDRIFHPEDHARRCCEPHAPAPRQLRV